MYLGIDWDAENKLVAVKQGAATIASFFYDGAGKRFQKTAAGVTTTYLYDDANVVEERLSTGQTYRYVTSGIDQPLAQRDSGGVVTYYVADHLGSIVQTTTSSGTVSFTREYDPWGRLLQGFSVAGSAFTGREWDVEVALYYYRARYYAPDQGRFIGSDPSGILDGPNVYIYVRNNSLRFVDPTGLKTSICCRYLSGGVGLATGYKHCFIVIVGNPALTGGATNIYSLFPEAGVGVPRKNDARDSVPYYKDQTTCYPVGHCDAEKEKCIDKNYTDPGPSKNYKSSGPNSNTYTRYTTTQAKCVPPQIPDAPGY